MNKKTIMAMPAACFCGVVAACVIGIILGSFRDFDINVALANKTNLGAFFATYGSYFPTASTRQPAHACTSG